MLDDKTLALLGDREAAERLTAAGVLLECPFCGGSVILEGSLAGEVWYFCGEDGCSALAPSSADEYGARLKWNTRTSILDPAQLALLRIGAEPRKFEEDKE